MAEIHSVSWFKTWYCVCVFYHIFLYVRQELQKSMKKTFQKSQALEQIIKNIPGAVAMYHDH